MWHITAAGRHKNHSVDTDIFRQVEKHTRVYLKYVIVSQSNANCLQI